MTLKMPSSVSVGSRFPSSCLIFSYSSDVRPCCRSTSGEKEEVIAVVMGSFYCRTCEGTRHQYLWTIRFFDAGPTSGKIQANEGDHRGYGRAHRSWEDGPGQGFNG